MFFSLVVPLFLELSRVSHWFHKGAQNLLVRSYETIETGMNRFFLKDFLSRLLGGSLNSTFCCGMETN